MSIDYKEFKKKPKKKQEYNLGIPPQSGKESIPSFVWAVAEKTGTENYYYEYKNNKKELCFIIRRYEPYSKGNNTSKKNLVPYSFDLDSQSWVTAAWEKERPLFKGHLIKDTDKIIILEGEKTVLAAEKLFPDYRCVTWSGGSKQVNITDFTPLKNKQIILWPDNDVTGIEAMHEVAKILIENDISDDIQIVFLPDKFSESWDVADAITHGGMTYQGLLDSKIEYDPDEYIKIWEKINKKNNKKILKSKIEYLTEKYVYIRALTSFFEKDTFKIISKEMINDWNLEHTQNEESLARQLLKQKNLIKAHGVLTHAGLAAGVVNVDIGQYEFIDPGIYYNTYRSSGIISKPGNVDKILEYYSWYVGNNWKIIEQYIAFMVQNPGVKIRWSPVITSVEGGGKNLLATLISRILGDHNCNTQLKFDHVTSKFANVLLGLQFGVINELDLSSKKNIKGNTNALKTIVSDSILTIELKGKPQIKIPNFANFFIFSNDDDCLYLTKESRRYLITIIKHSQEAISQKLEDEGYKDLILKALEFGEDTICHLKNHFENVVTIEDPKLFSRNAPKTDDFYDMVNRARPELHKALDHRLDANIFPFENYETWADEEIDPNRNINKVLTNPQFSGLVVAEDLYNFCRDDKVLSKEFITREIIIKWCKSRCIPWSKTDGSTQDQKQIVVKINGSTHRPNAYLIKDLEIDGKKLSNMTEGELGTHYSLSHVCVQINKTNYSQRQIRSESPLADKDQEYFPFKA